MKVHCGILLVTAEIMVFPLSGATEICGHQGHKCNPLLNQMCCEGITCMPGPDLDWSNAICMGEPEVSQECRKESQACNDHKQNQSCCGGLKCNTGTGSRWGECIDATTTTTTTPNRPGRPTIRPRFIGSDWQGGPCKDWQGRYAGQSLNILNFFKRLCK